MSIALIGGTAFVAMNQLGIILAGQATALVWFKAVLTYLTPLLVSNVGVLSATRQGVHPRSQPGRCHQKSRSRQTRSSGRRDWKERMKFTQIIEFKTARIDEFNAELDAWMARTDGHRTPHRANGSGRRGPIRFTVEFSSHERGRENSNRPETAEFAAFLAAIAHGSLIFCNLDVLREADL